MCRGCERTRTYSGTSWAYRAHDRPALHMVVHVDGECQLVCPGTVKGPGELAVAVHDRALCRDPVVAAVGADLLAVHQPLDAGSHIRPYDHGLTGCSVCGSGRGGRSAGLVRTAGRDLRIRRSSTGSQSDSFHARTADPIASRYQRCRRLSCPSSSLFPEESEPATALIADSENPSEQRRRQLGKRVGLTALAGSNPASSVNLKQALTCGNAVRIRSARDGVASNIEAASLNSGLSFRPPSARNPAFRGPDEFAAVR